MSAFCCTVKILFYLILICYHMVDFVFDWYTFAVLLRDNKFSGVSISKSEESMIRILFGLSCVTGTIFSFAMIVAYIYYIKHHWQCMKNADRQLVNFELCISVLELFLKDIIQSGILFWAYDVSQSSATSNPDSMSIVFSVCSIVAHLKLCLCFLTKLCGWGAGEDCPEEFCACCGKAFLCIIGFGGSAIFVVLTGISFYKEIVAHLKLCLCFLTKLCGCGVGEERCDEHTVTKAISCIIGFGGSAICLILTAVAFSNQVK
ncbi:uncharacterized protein LOC114963007 [Acropora millepora]|uniref:uncharacterized protein LOC114963007 n=1 Tax=Acropora millepora TaxID=45264 RepID=UPI001CF433E4|nr:uncharacterized protein LOC114963007 [Acropora millepora]